MISKEGTIVAILAVVLINGICVSGHEGLSCNSCGDECTQSCGTRHFRTCCFNYLRKRSDPGVMVKTLAPPIDVTTFSVSAKPMDIPHDQHLQAELKAFKEEQKTRTQSFIAQLQRFFFGQISAFLYVQLLESRRFYDMMQVSDGHSLAAATVVSSSPRET